MGVVVLQLQFGSFAGAIAPFQTIVAQEPQLLFWLKETLKYAGWTVEFSSDATGLSASGDVLGNPRGGAYTSGPLAPTYARVVGGMGSMANTPTIGGVGARFKIRQPAIAFGDPGYPGGRAFEFTRALDNVAQHVGPVTYYRADGTPVILSRYLGNPFGPGFTEQWHASIIAEDAPPYGFCCVTWRIGASPRFDAPYSFFLDFLDTAIVGDPEPYVFGSSQSAQQAYEYPLLGSGDQTIGPPGSLPINVGAFTWYGAGTPNAVVQQVFAAVWSNSITGNSLQAPRRTGLNPFTGNEESMPILWTADTARTGLRHPRGFGRLMRWNGTTLAAPGPTANSWTRALFGDVSVPWTRAALAVAPGTGILSPITDTTPPGIEADPSNPPVVSYNDNPSNPADFPPQVATSGPTASNLDAPLEAMYLTDLTEARLEETRTSELVTPTISESEITLEDLYKEDYLIPSVQFVEVSVGDFCQYGNILVTVISPLPVGSKIPRNSRIRFRIKDSAQAFRRILPAIDFPGLGRREVIHDGDEFLPLFDGSTRTLLSVLGAPEEWEYDLNRIGGWPDHKIELFPYAADATGSEPPPFVPTDPTEGACPLPGTIVVTVLAPLPVGSRIASNAHVRFRIKDLEWQFRRILPAMTYPVLDRQEFVHDGDDFLPSFLGSSRALVSSDPEEWEYDLVRPGGWPMAPGTTDSVITLTPYAFDRAGGETP